MLQSDTGDRTGSTSFTRNLALDSPHGYQESQHSVGRQGPCETNQKINRQGMPKELEHFAPKESAMGTQGNSYLARSKIPPFYKKSPIHQLDRIKTDPTKKQRLLLSPYLSKFRYNRGRRPPFPDRGTGAREI